MKPGLACAHHSCSWGKIGSRGRTRGEASGIPTPGVPSEAPSSWGSTGGPRLLPRKAFEYPAGRGLARLTRRRLVGRGQAAALRCKVL